MLLSTKQHNITVWIEYIVRLYVNGLLSKWVCGKILK